MRNTSSRKTGKAQDPASRFLGRTKGACVVFQHELYALAYIFAVSQEEYSGVKFSMWCDPKGAWVVCALGTGAPGPGDILVLENTLTWLDETYTYDPTSNTMKCGTTTMTMGGVK